MTLSLHAQWVGTYNCCFTRNFIEMKLILILLTFYICSTYCLINLTNVINFLPNILEYKNVKLVSIYSCFKQQENLYVSKILSQANVHINFIKTSMAANYDYKMFSGQNSLGFIIDLSCEEYNTVLSMAGKYNLYQSHYKWLIIDTKQQVLKDNSMIVKTFANVTLRMDSDVIIALLENDTNVTFYDIYNPGFNQSKVKVTPLGFWMPEESKINFTYNLSKYEQRKNMTGVLFKSALIYTHRGNITSVDAYYRDVRKNEDSMSKIHYSLLMHIHEVHNFTLQLTLARKWFGNAIGGMDGGIAKFLYEKTIDFGAICGLMKVDRIPLYDFVSPTYPFRTCFIFRNPGTSGKIQNEFLQPFVSSVWFYILGYILLFCVVLKCAFFAERLLFNNFEENSWTAAYLLTWAVFCQQGATFVPKPISGRCTLLSLLVMSLLLYNYYTSSIVSSLLSGLPPPFNTIEELTSSDLEVGIEDVVYMRTLFEVTNDSRIKNLYNHKVLGRNNKPSYVKIEEGISKVKTGGYAYHTEPTNGYQIIEKMFEPYEICDLAEINVFQPTVLWVYTQKRGQYRKMLAVGYLKMLESGIIFRQLKMWVTAKPACLANTHLVEVGIQQLSPAFIVLLLGLLASVVLLILEIFWIRNKPKIYYYLSKFQFGK